MNGKPLKRYDRTESVIYSGDEPCSVRYSDEEILGVTDREVSMSVPIAEVELLKRYTLWLERRGFFREDLQVDYEHQIETFLKDFNVDD